MAYKLAEDENIQLPVNVCYDGHYLSHLSARVEIPGQAQVDAFLPPRGLPECRLDPDKPMMQGVFLGGKLFAEYRYKHCLAMSDAKQKIDDLDLEFHRAFGRTYGGLIEEYKTADAEYVLIMVGSAASTAKVIIDQKREQWHQDRPDQNQDRASLSGRTIDRSPGRQKSHRGFWTGMSVSAGTPAWCLWKSGPL